MESMNATVIKSLRNIKTPVTNYSRISVDNFL